MKDNRLGWMIGLALVLCYGMAMAGSLKKFEDYGAQQYFSARTSVISSNPVVGIMTSFSVLPIGGAAEFRVHHATGTGSGFNENVSSTVYLTAGISYSDIPAGTVVNPNIEISRIDAATTVYLDIGYLIPREPGR